MVSYLIVRNRLPPLSIAPRTARFVDILLEIKKLFRSYSAFVVYTKTIIRLSAVSTIITQHIVTLPKYGHGELNICRPHITDILRYT